MDSIHYAMCLDYRISPEVFQKVEDLVSKYSHVNFNFFVKPMPFGIMLRAETFPKSKNRVRCERCFSPWFLESSNQEDLEKFVRYSIESLIEEINQYKLLKI